MWVAASGTTTLGAGGAASDYFTGDGYLIPVSTNLLLEDDVSSLVVPTDPAAVPLLAYFLLISSCLTSSVRAVTVVISGIIILNLLLSNFSLNLLSSSSVRSLLKTHKKD